MTEKIGCFCLFLRYVRGKESKDFVVLLYKGSVPNLQVNELVKDLVRYSEELHKKHKQIKVIESQTEGYIF